MNIWNINLQYDTINFVDLIKEIIFISLYIKTYYILNNKFLIFNSFKWNVILLSNNLNFLTIFL
jgi:hypothetical protein